MERASGARNGRTQPDRSANMSGSHENTATGGAMAPGQGRTGSSVSFSCGVKTYRDSRHKMVPRLCFGVRGGSGGAASCPLSLAGGACGGWAVTCLRSLQTDVNIPLVVYLLICGPLNSLDRESKIQVLAALEILKEQGPNLKRPLVGKINGSRLVRSMKELRPGSAGQSEIRILFVFDPKRKAILLVGGDKQAKWNKWYKTAIPEAERRYVAWLENQYGKETK